MIFLWIYLAGVAVSTLLATFVDIGETMNENKEFPHFSPVEKHVGVGIFILFWPVILGAILGVPEMRDAFKSDVAEAWKGITKSPS